MKLCRFDDNRLGVVRGGDVLSAEIEAIGEFDIRVAPEYAGRGVRRENPKYHLTGVKHCRGHARTSSLRRTIPWHRLGYR